MRLARPARKQPPETIVALIDVVFFLLVFALLIGRMDTTAPFRVTPPVAVTGSDMPAGGLTVAVGADGALALNGASVGRDALLSAAEAALRADPALRLRLNADGLTPLRHVLPLIEELKARGAGDVVLVVTPDAG